MCARFPDFQVMAHERSPLFLISWRISLKLGRTASVHSNAAFMTTLSGARKRCSPSGSTSGITPARWELDRLNPQTCRDGPDELERILEIDTAFLPER
jgi:hypothetical protein